MMLGFAINSWMRFFVLGLLAGGLLGIVSYEPIAILGRFAAVAAFFGLILTAIYMRSYAPWAWRRLMVRARRWSSVVTGAVPLHGERTQRPLLSP
jgi:hypothetical protein